MGQVFHLNGDKCISRCSLTSRYSTWCCCSTGVFSTGVDLQWCLLGLIRCISLSYYLFSNVMAYRLFDTLNFYVLEGVMFHLHCWFCVFQIKDYKNLFLSAILVVTSVTEHEHQTD